MNFKNLMACLIAMVVSTTAIYAQCRIQGSANFSNLNPCGGSISVTGNAMLQSYSSDPPSWSNCNGSQVLVQVQYFTGSTWTTVASQTVSIVTGAYNISFTPTVSAYYRIYQTVSSSGTGCSCAVSYVSVSSYITINTAVTAGFSIGSWSATTTSAYYGFGYGCPNATFTLTTTSSSGTQTFSPQWKLTFQECNSAGVLVSGSTPYGQTSFVSGWPAASYDMKTWNPTHSFTLGSAGAVGKFWLITLEIKNGCSGTSSVKQGLVYINTAITFPTGSYGVLNNNTAMACTIGSTSSNPCPVCNAATVFMFTASTGWIKGYDKEVQRWNGSTWVTEFGPTNYTLSGGAPTLNYAIPLTGSGFTWITSGLYRINITFKGLCGDNPPFTQYFNIVTCKTDELATDVQLIDQNTASIGLFPNPANEIATLTISNASEKPYTVKLFNINGQEMKTIVDNSKLEMGENHIQFEINELSSGSYLLKVFSEEGDIKTLKLIKN